MPLSSCLRCGGVSIDLGLRRERLLELCAGRCGENGRHERHHEVDPPWASSCRYFGFERDHDNKRLLKITCTRLAPAAPVIEPSIRTNPKRLGSLRLREVPPKIQ